MNTDEYYTRIDRRYTWAIRASVAALIAVLAYTYCAWRG